MTDLFSNPATPEEYGAGHIRILKGLEAVRLRPGMYIGGTDERALHHLAAEILDNSMDEVVARHATRIEVAFEAGGRVTIRDNGRGIPVETHPERPDKSTVEVIFTELHSGGKFGGDAYQTSGGLHGVGASVVNALSEDLVVEVARDRQLWRQSFIRGLPQGPLVQVGAAPNRRGTSVSFVPDPEIFTAGTLMKPWRLYRMARSKAYLVRGVEIRWSCDPALIPAGDETPAEATFHFPGGLEDFLAASLAQNETVTGQPFAGTVEAEGGRVEWAIAWPSDGDAFVHSYCNTVPTPEGGTHEAGLRGALARALRGYGELVGNKRAAQITGDDALGAAAALLSVFIREPQFQGQTKEKLSSAEATRLVETAVKDRFDHFLTEDPPRANALLTYIVERAEERLRRKQEKEVGRKSATRRLRLPGKLADCATEAAGGTEIFLVEGDSAGGSAKQARDRATQAVLPLKGKIMNVVSAGQGKMAQNQELSDLIQALGCGTGSRFRLEDLRYERVIIMTDADVDGAHIASLLMTFFWRETPGLIRAGRLYLAQPPLYRLTHGAKTVYAMDDADRERLMKSTFKANANVDVGRFKGLGEMMPAQLRDTTMAVAKRTLLRVTVEDGDGTADLIERLMGRKPELRFRFIQERAPQAQALDV